MNLFQSGPWWSLNRALSLLCAVIVMVSFNSFAAGGADIAGQWAVADGKSRVEVYQAADGRVEGRVVWLRDPAYLAGDAEAGVLRHDRKNPDASLRSRPVMGLVIMKGFSFDGKRTWSGGTLYDPKTGNTYKGRMTLLDGRTLDLRGYIGVPLFGRSEKWVRWDGSH
ncbi:MAG: DUF2147 domain-containing protein [Candidatus Omnitrophota bacterium]